MKRYSQLTLEQRYGIYILHKPGHTQSEISKAIGVRKSTICRELKRNRGNRGYRPRQANKFAANRRKKRNRPRIDGGTLYLHLRCYKGSRIATLFIFI